jgi:hypothetical protein
MLIHRKANLLRDIGAAFSDGVDCSDEFGWIAALGQIAIRACGKSGPDGTGLNIGGEDKNSQLRPLGSQVSYELKPADTRHAEIEYEKIGGTFVQQPVNGFTVRRFSTDRKLVHGRQKLFQALPNDGVIVSNDRSHESTHVSPQPTTILGYQSTPIKDLDPQRHFPDVLDAKYVNCRISTCGRLKIILCWLSECSVAVVRGWRRVDAAAVQLACDRSRVCS